MSTLRIAWRNLFRNSGRTAITFAAITASTGLLIVTNALMNGMVADMVHSVTDITLGEAQVHHPDYRTERSLYDTVEAPERVLAAARVAGIPASARAYGYGLLSSGSKSAGAQFCGVSPGAERDAADLARSLLQGEFLPDRPGRKIVLGRKLARTLNAGVGTELVVVVQAADGSMGNDLYTVAGILKSVGESADRSLALVHERDFAELFVLPGGVHEIVLNSRGRLEPADVAAAVRGAAGANEVKTWRELMPAIANMLDLLDAWMLVFGLFFFMAAGLGVLNTMLMATYERIPEFGLLKAIGTSPWRILRDIAIEALLLGFAGSVAGGALGVAGSLYLTRHPIDLSSFAEGFSTSGLAFSPYWTAALDVRSVGMPMALMWAITFLAALYPATRAARFDPVKALSHV